MTQKNGGGINYSEYTLKKYRERAFGRYAEYDGAEFSGMRRPDGVHSGAEFSGMHRPDGIHGGIRVGLGENEQDAFGGGKNGVIDINPDDLEKTDKEDININKRSIPNKEEKVNPNKQSFPDKEETNNPNKQSVFDKEATLNPNRQSIPDIGPYRNGSHSLPSLKKEKKSSGFRSKTGRLKKVATFICAAVMVFSLFALVYDILSGGAVTASVSSADAGYATVYYAVCIGEYKTQEEAKNQAVKLMEQGDAGYVISDKNYKLIAAVYLNKDDAEKIKDGYINKSVNASVYKIKIKKVNLVKYDPERRARIEGMLGYAGGVYGELYTISNALDQKKTDIVSARNKISALIREINTLNINIGSQDGDQQIFEKIRSDLTAAAAALGYLLTPASLSPSFTANVKYTYVMILNMQRALLNEI
jgi:hypothetical protein